MADHCAVKYLPHRGITLLPSEIIPWTFPGSGNMADVEQTCNTQMSLGRRLACCTGHTINELLKQVFFSFMLIFLVKVIELPGVQVGLIFLIGQVVDGFLNLLVGYCSDNVFLPGLGHCLGRRKAWHMVGTIAIAVFTPLMFTRCLICSEDSSLSLKVVYYTTTNCLIAAAYALIDIGHLAIISDLSKTQDECIALNSLR